MKKDIEMDDIGMSRDFPRPVKGLIRSIPSVRQTASSTWTAEGSGWAKLEVQRGVRREAECSSLFI